MDENERFECWAIVELYGHRKTAGRVSEATIGGSSFIRIDTPLPDKSGSAGDGRLYASHFYGQGSIYAFHPVSEEVARDAATRIRSDPISEWDYPSEIKQLIAQSKAQERLDLGDELDSDEIGF